MLHALVGILFLLPQIYLAKSSRDSAREAREIAEQANQIAALAQGPDVNSSSRSMGPLSAGEPVVVDAVLTNAGKMKAVNLHVTGDIQIATSSDPPPGLSMDDLANQGQLLAGDRMPVQLRTNAPLTAEQAESIFKGEAFIYVWIAWVSTNPLAPSRVGPDRVHKMKSGSTDCSKYGRLSPQQDLGWIPCHASPPTLSLDGRACEIDVP